MNRVRVLAWGLVLVAVGAVAYLKFGGDVPPSREVQKIIDGEPMRDMAAIDDMPKPLEASKWLAERTRRYRGLLKDFRCDVLVVPVQVEEMAFDRPTRLLMAGDLARALSTAKACVADPFVVESALGEGLRVFTAADIDALAADMKATTVVRTFAGHDQARHMRVTLQVDHRNDPQRAFARQAQKSFDDLTFSYTDSPYAQFHAALPRMLDAVGLPHQPVVVTKSNVPDSMPASPQQAIGSATPAASATNLMLLGMLAPMPDRRAADRLFAKAYLALQDIDGDDGIKRMRARAMLHLGCRPYALLEAADLKGAEADGLRAIANGDLVGARAALADSRDPWDYAFLSLETLDLEFTYLYHSDALVKKIPDTFSSAWQPFVSMRMTDSDTWTLPNPIALKESLDTTFPIQGESLKELTAGKFITGSFDPSAFAMSAARHVRKLIDQQRTSLCCATFTTTAQPLDLLLLYEARAETALVRQAYFYGKVQGNYERALALLKSYDEVVGGRPDAEVQRAYMEWSLQSSSTPQDIEDRKKRMHDAAKIAVAANPGQDATPSSALWYLFQAPGERYAAAVGHAYCQDFPVRAEWPGDPETYEARLQFSSSDVAPLKQLLDRADAEHRKALIAELDHRFIGNPEAVTLRLDNPVEGHEVSIDDVKKAITTDADNWTLYDRLARMYMDDGKYREASELAQSYPPFHKKDPTRTVEYSNDVIDVATALYYAGDIEDARPLLKIAADYANGSQASVRAQARLYVLDADWPDAAMTFLGAAQHYASRSDFRDFLSLLFAAGESQDAWQGFSQLIGKLPGPQLWTAALIGHRRDNTSEKDLRQWLQNEANTLTRAKGDDALVNYALTEQLIDRAPPPDDFAEFVKTLAGPSGVVGRSGRFTSFFGALGSENERRIGPGAYGAARQQGKTIDSDAPSRHYLFALAYSSLRHGKFEEAAQQFDHFAQIYDTESVTEWGFVLPYFAFAAAQSGDATGLQKFLDDRTIPENEWGGQLAEAIFDAIHGKDNDADKRLDTAFRHRPASGAWPTTTSYQYAEVCIWLFEKTGDKRFKERALDWARKHVQIEPAHAWAYALVSRYSDSAKERAAMLSKALYLDPQSYWATSTPKDAQVVALASLKVHKPFEMQKNAAPNQHL